MKSLKSKRMVIDDVHFTHHDMVHDLGGAHAAWEARRQGDGASKARAYSPGTSARQLWISMGQLWQLIPGAARPLITGLGMRSIS